MRFIVGSGRALALLSLIVACGDAVQAQARHSRPPAGHLREIAASRAAVAPVIDGRLDDPAWQSGAIAEQFWVSDTQQPPSDPTLVTVLYDDHALYFAFVCRDTRPDLIRAQQIVRDAALGFDDRVTVELDPFHNHRSVSRFTVTARGTQSDLMAGGRARKREWKGEWTAAAQRTDDGWTAELAIPFEVLAFDPETDTFGINFSRYQSRTREWSEWADLTPQRLAAESGHLTGLRLPQPSQAGRLAVMQYLTGAIGPSLRGTDASAMNSGIDLRYQWRRALTSVVSTRPDFSGVDEEVPDIAFSHTERFVRDHRPFFQEGSQFFGDREVFHSGRIDDFDVAAKTFGRLDGYQVGVLAAADSDTGRADYVGHVVREVGPTFNVSATVAASNRAAVDNTALQLRAGGRLGRNVQVKGSVARTSTDLLGQGMRGRGEVGYKTAHWYSAGWAEHTDAEYFPANGFLAGDVIGTSGQGAYGGYSRAFAGAWMRRADASVSHEVRHTTEGLRQRETTSVFAGGETAANILVNAGMTVGHYRPRGAAPGDWAATLDADRYYLASAFYQSPTGQFGYGAQYSWGAAGIHDYTSLSPSVWLAPSPHFSFSYSFERAAHDTVQRQHVVSGSWDITAGQSLAARWVEYDGGYYRLSYRRTLAHGIDAFGIYTTDPYDPGRLNVKLVWAWLR